MKTGIRRDYSAIPGGKPFNIRLLVGLEWEQEVRTDAPAFNIGLVLDRSGSMSGEKLERVKEAAEGFFRSIKPADHAALVSFDNEVKVEIEPVEGASIDEKVISKIKAIRSGGTTYLSGGYEQGYDLIKSFHQRGVFSRIILLTDGIANVGEQNPEKLAMIAKKFAAAGITTSTIGVGEDFEENLLNSMAESGGGNNHFVETPAEAKEIFADELGSLLSLGATGTMVRFISHVKGLSAGQFNYFDRDNQGRYIIGDVYYRRERTLLLELDIPAQSAEGILQLGELEVSYRQPGRSEEPVKTETFPVTISIVSDEEFAGVRPDPEVIKHLCRILIARAKLKMLDLMRKGKFKEADKEIKKVTAKVKQFNLNDDEINGEIEVLEERRHLMLDHGHAYFISDQKRLFFESSNAGSGRIYANRAMYERRIISEYDPLDKLRKSGKNSKKNN